MPRGALQRLLLALDRGDPVMLTDALLEVVDRPGQLDEPRLVRVCVPRISSVGVTSRVALPAARP